MAAEIVTACIAASSTIVLAGATYWFTKQREREAELRKEKLERYKDFVSSLSGSWNLPRNQCHRTCRAPTHVASDRCLLQVASIRQASEAIPASTPDRWGLATAANRNRFQHGTSLPEFLRCSMSASCTSQAIMVVQTVGPASMPRCPLNQ